MIMSLYLYIICICTMLLYIYTSTVIISSLFCILLYLYIVKVRRRIVRTYLVLVMLIFIRIKKSLIYISILNYLYLPHAKIHRSNLQRCRSIFYSTFQFLFKAYIYINTKHNTCIIMCI